MYPPKIRHILKAMLSNLHIFADIPRGEFFSLALSSRMSDPGHQVGKVHTYKGWSEGGFEAKVIP